MLPFREGIPQKLEHNDIRWITVDEIDQFAFCPADEEILIKAKSNRRGRKIRWKPPPYIGGCEHTEKG